MDADDVEEVAGDQCHRHRPALEAMVYWAMRTMPVDLGDINLDMVVPASGAARAVPPRQSRP